MEDHTLKIRSTVARINKLFTGMPSTEKINEENRRVCTVTVIILRCMRSSLTRSDFLELQTKEAKETEKVISNNHTCHKAREDARNKKKITRTMTNDNLLALSTSWDRREDRDILKINRDQKNRGSANLCMITREKCRI
jgi:hypothetical protein